MSWMQVSIETGIEWPVRQTIIVYEGRSFYLRPATRFSKPDVLLQFDGTQSTPSHNAILEFLSILTWLKRQRIRTRVTAVSTARNEPIGIGPPPFIQNVALNFQCNHFPDLSHSNAKLALAHFRDALQNQSIYQSFMAYWKIAGLIEREKSKSHTNLLVRTIQSLQSEESTKRIAQLLNSGLSHELIVEKHLYGSRRCAMSHTNGLNPDDVSDIHQINLDLPVMYEIASTIIESELGIQCETALYNSLNLEPPKSENLFQITSLNKILQWKNGPLWV